MRTRDGFALIVVMMLLAGGFSIIIPDASDAVPDGTACNGVLIYEVSAKFDSDNEGFSLKNYGTSPINLQNYYLSDTSSLTAVHKYTITSSLSLGAGESVVFVKESASSWFGDTSRTICTYDSKGSAGSQFIFNNGGDCLYLYDSSDNLIDTVAFGNTDTSSVPGWSGISVDLGFKGEAVRRVETTDTNTYFDWTSLYNGYTSNDFRNVPTFAGATVTPFTFPECKGKPIFQTILAADSSVCISIYMLTSNEMISALATLASEGKTVKVLLESKPLGYDHDYDKLKNITENGGEVRFIGVGDTDRYSYVHNKYAIIDGDTVIVTSENWTGGNLGGGKGNRGWGAVVESSGYAAYMQTYFDNDFGGTDVQTLAQYEAAHDPITPASLPTKSQVASFVDGLSYTTSSFTGDIRMYMSPDNTFKAVQYYIDNATTRVYTEQMDVGASYLTLTDTSPLTAMVDAAGRGVDARFLLAKSTTEAEALIATLNASGVKAAKMTSNPSLSYATMHNKGAVIDNAVWLSSVNWTENAFINNRECGLYIMSEDVANFYAAAYEIDWANDYVDPGLTYHHVTYDVDGGSTAAPTQKDVAENGKFTVAEYNGTKKGFVFDGWSDGTKTYQPGSKYTMGAADVTLKAVWKSTSSDSESDLADNLMEGQTPIYIGIIAAIILAVAGIVWKSTKKKARKTVKKAVKGKSKKK